MKQIELLQEQSESENTESNSNSYDENQEKNNQPIEHTPIIARFINDQWFGTIGQYRITKTYDTYEELEYNVADTCITWEDMTKVISAQYDWLKEELENIKRIANDKN